MKPLDRALECFSPSTEAQRERAAEVIQGLVTTYRADCEAFAVNAAPRKRGPRERLERRGLVMNCFLSLEGEGIAPAAHAKGNVARLAEAVHELSTGQPHPRGWPNLAKALSAGLRGGQRLTEFVAECGSVIEADLGVFINQEAIREEERLKAFNSAKWTKGKRDRKSNM
jgi:hypothetical protein